MRCPRCSIGVSIARKLIKGLLISCTFFWWLSMETENALGRTTSEQVSSSVRPCLCRPRIRERLSRSICDIHAKMSTKHSENSGQSIAGWMMSCLRFFSRGITEWLAEQIIMTLWLSPYYSRLPNRLEASFFGMELAGISTKKENPFPSLKGGEETSIGGFYDLPSVLETLGNELAQPQREWQEVWENESPKRNLIPDDHIIKLTLQSVFPGPLPSILHNSGSFWISFPFTSVYKTCRLAFSFIFWQIWSFHSNLSQVLPMVKSISTFSSVSLTRSETWFENWKEKKAREMCLIAREIA